MPATALKCRECKTEYALEARYVCEKCFGPLEVAYDLSGLAGDPDHQRRRIQAGPQNIWRYADFLPLAAGSPAAQRTRACIPSTVIATWSCNMPNRSGFSGRNQCFVLT